MKRRRTAFFDHFAPEARETSVDFPEKYATNSKLQFTLLDVLKGPPILEHGNVNEIIGKFDGAEQLKDAVDKLRSLLCVV